MPLPNLTLENTSVPTYKPVNGDESGKQFLKLVDRAKELFPDQSVWISINWKFSYRHDGSGFRKVIDHLSDVTSSERTDAQAAHIVKMLEYGSETWHWK